MGSVGSETVVSCSWARFPRRKFDYGRCWLRGRCHAVLKGLPEPDWIGKLGQPDIVNAGSVKFKLAKIEEPAKEALHNIHFFDCAQLEFLGRAAQKAAFVDEPLIGYPYLGRPDRRHDCANGHGACDNQWYNE
jgi:hypothetical protein